VKTQGSAPKHLRTCSWSGVAIVLAVPMAGFWQGGVCQAAQATTVTVPLTIAAHARPASRPPTQLQARLQMLGQSIDGNVGIAIHDVTANWTAGYQARGKFPQQSVSKLWVAIALLDAVDRGDLRLDDPIVVRREDLTLFNQPIRARVGENGFSTTLGGLMTRALVESDNTANDVLLRRVGGPGAIRAMLARKQLVGIGFGPGEKALQTRTAGLAWSDTYSDPHSFRKARAAVPKADRQKALEAYLASPPDGATPDAIARALAGLEHGTLLSRASTILLLDTMASSKTGHRRLRAGLGQGWVIAHKTGTGQELGGMATGFNDVGLLRARSGRVYTVAVMISHSRAPIERRQALIADVARTIANYEEPLLTPLTSVASNSACTSTTIRKPGT